MKIDRHSTNNLIDTEQYIHWYSIRYTIFFGETNMDCRYLSIYLYLNI